MAYGHAERTLAAIRLLEAETRDLLDGLPQLDPEQSQWRQEVIAPPSQRCQTDFAELPAA
jgi:hypothetical protein